MDVNDEECDTELGLAISVHYNGSPSTSTRISPASLNIFSLATNSSDDGHANKLAPATCSSEQYDDTHNVINQQPSYGVSIKRKRDGISDEEEEAGGTRKKLRLLKDQAAFLEESFKQNNTLNLKQKQALAKHLNLRPRQIEVWFQNRRARTKLKQTEVDCEFLKGCYESLTEENKRLQKELAQLRSLKLSAASPLYMQFPTPTLTMCPSCERVKNSHNVRPLQNPQRFYPSYTSHSSLAC